MFGRFLCDVERIDLAIICLADLWLEVLIMVVLSKGGNSAASGSLLFPRDLLRVLRSGEYSFWFNVVETSFMRFSIEVVAIRYEMWLDYARSMAFLP